MQIFVYKLLIFNEVIFQFLLIKICYYWYYWVKEKPRILRGYNYFIHFKIRYTQSLTNIKKLLDSAIELLTLGADL